MTGTARADLGAGGTVIVDNILLLVDVPSLALQVLIDGVLIGAILALPAYGMALVWGVMNIINIAQGEFVLLGGFITFIMLNQLDISPLYGIVVAFIALYIVGWIIYRTIIFRIVDRDLFNSILATFGISILMQQLMNLAFGADVQTADPGLESWALAGDAIVVAPIRLIAFGLVFILGALLLLFLNRSRMGRAIRATAQNARAARIMGVNTDHVYATTYALNAAICGAAGALVVMTWVIHPFLGILYTVRSFLIVVVAGLGNLGAVVAAALGLGALENYAGFILGSEFQVAFVYILMVAILIWRSLRLRRKRQYLK